MAGGGIATSRVISILTWMLAMLHVDVEGGRSYTLDNAVVLAPGRCRLSISLLLPICMRDMVAVFLVRFVVLVIATTQATTTYLRIASSI